MKPLTPEENTKLINEITKELQQEEALEKGKFSVISIIGHGTFGVVYRAKDEKTGDSYFKSPYSGIFRETRYILDNTQLLCFVWTTKPKILNVEE